MPTGYTAKVNDGSITSLGDFILTLAPAFGAFIEFRDHHLNPEDIKPKLFDPETNETVKYHRENLEDSRKKLSELQAWSKTDITAHRLLHNAEMNKQKAEYFSEQQNIKTRYENMLKKLESWNPSGDMSSVKSFAVDQIQSSLKADCRRDNEPDRWYGAPTYSTDEEYFSSLEKEYNRDIEYHKTQLKEQLSRLENRRLFVIEFLESIKSIKKGD